MSHTTQQDSQIKSDKIVSSIEPFKIKKFGIMVNSLDMSQKGYHIVKSLNCIVDNDCSFSPIVFYEEYSKSVDVNRFCTLLSKESWGFDGVVIATSLETAKTLLNCPCPVKKFFYVWNLEWLYGTYPYKHLQDLYQGDIELIARIQEHADILTSCWKKPSYIMDNFDPEVLTQIVSENYIPSNR